MPGLRAHLPSERYKLSFRTCSDAAYAASDTDAHSSRKSRAAANLRLGHHRYTLLYNTLSPEDRDDESG
jgi:hypothetical protein